VRTQPTSVKAETAIRGRIEAGLTEGAVEVTTSFSGSSKEIEPWVIGPRGAPDALSCSAPAGSADSLGPSESKSACNGLLLNSSVIVSPRTSQR